MALGRREEVGREKWAQYPVMTRELTESALLQGWYRDLPRKESWLTFMTSIARARKISACPTGGNEQAASVCGQNIFI